MPQLTSQRWRQWSLCLDVNLDIWVMFFFQINDTYLLGRMHLLCPNPNVERLHFQLGLLYNVVVAVSV